jgi:hypothetical protein
MGILVDMEVERIGFEIVFLADILCRGSCSIFKMRAERKKNFTEEERKERKKEKEESTKVILLMCSAS